MYCISTGIQRNSTNVLSHLQTHRPEYAHVYGIDMGIIHRALSHRYLSATTDIVLFGGKYLLGHYLAHVHCLVG